MYSFIRLVAFVRRTEWAENEPKELVPRGAGQPRQCRVWPGTAGQEESTPGSASGAYAVEIYCAEKRKTFAMSEFVCAVSAARKGAHKVASFGTV